MKRSVAVLFALMSNGQYKHHVSCRVISVKRQISRLTSGDHQFTQTIGNGPPNERVSLRNRQSVQHEVYCLNGKFGFAAQQKIDQFLKVISRFGWVKNSRYSP